MAIEYRARKGGMLSTEDARILGPYLETMAKNLGSLNVEDIIEDAKDPSSPLHEHFDWDPQTAAMERWKFQARSIINSILIVQKEDGGLVERRLFLSLSPNHDADGEDEGQSGPIYIHVQIVLANSRLRDKMWDKAIKELASWARRWAAYPELKPLAREVETIIAEHSGIATKSTKVEEIVQISEPVMADVVASR